MELMNDDVVVMIASHLNDTHALANTCRRFRRLLLENTATRAHIFCQYRGTSEAAHLIHRRSLLNDPLGRRTLGPREYDLVMALMQRPHFLNQLSDNMKMDIVLQGISTAVVHVFIRDDLSVWRNWLPSCEAIDTHGLVRLFSHGETSTIRALVDGGARLSIPPCSPKPIQICLGAFFGLENDFKWCLTTLGFRTPLAISMDSLYLDIPTLRVFLEHFSEAWKTDPEAARVLRREYSQHQPGSERHILIRSYDPFESLSSSQLLHKLEDCIRDGSRPEMWDEFDSILQHGKICLHDISVAFICDHLSPRTDHRMATKLVEVVLPELMSDAGRDFMHSLARETMRMWEITPDNDWDMYITTGSNSSLFSRAYRDINGFLPHDASNLCE